MTSESIRHQLERQAAPVPGVSDTRYELAVFDEDFTEQAGGTAPTYAQALSEGQHYLAQCQQDGPHTLEVRRVGNLDPAFPVPDDAPVPLAVSERRDERNPECVKAWPECWDGGYDPRCCRFPKSCSCGVRHTLPALPDDAQVIEPAERTILVPTQMPAAVSERLPELRGMFERILCVARSSDQRTVGNIELADRLIKAVVSWSALPLPSGEAQP